MKTIIKALEAAAAEENESSLTRAIKEMADIQRATLAVLSEANARADVTTAAMRQLLIGQQQQIVHLTAVALTSVSTSAPPKGPTPPPPNFVAPTEARDDDENGEPERVVFGR